MNFRRHSASVIRINQEKQILVVGGLGTKNYIQIPEIYDVKSDKWTF